MKNSICKKVFITALAAVTVLTTILPTLPAKAASMKVESGVVDFGQGDAELIIKGNFGQPLDGKEFEIYRLLDAENSVGRESINYTFNDTYKSTLQTIVGGELGKEASDVTEYEVIDYIQSLNSYIIEGAQATQTYEKSYSDFRYFVEELRDELKVQNQEGDVITVGSTDSNNSITISGLPYGYYIIDEITDVEDTNSAASLCMVNTANPTAQINIKSDLPTVDKRALEKTNSSGIERSVNIWADAIDCEIGENVYFSALSNVPDMNGYDTYYFAWYDAMDEELTFRAETVNIEITDMGKTYVLGNNEYSVEDLPPESNMRFKVEIKDLKAIIDREFDCIDANGENIYSQQINLTYAATLNYLAAEKTGKPGIENSIQIEYSNDPDSAGAGSTGLSAWDTTVCFTYKMNITKENNYGRTLEGAKFRLYEDENCENEIAFTETDDGYIVINQDSSGSLQPSALSETDFEEPYMVSDADGSFTIYGLDSNKMYYLKEVEAPAGYRKLEKPIMFFFEVDFSSDRFHYVKGDGAGDELFNGFYACASVEDFYEGEWAHEVYELYTEVEDGSANFTVVNYIGAKLPATGSTMTLVLVIVGISCVVLAFFVRKTVRKNEA